MGSILNMRNLTTISLGGPRWTYSVVLARLSTQQDRVLAHKVDEMPTYEYACKSCSEGFDIVQSFYDEPLTVCPSCGGELRKVFGNIGIAFKGSGFYRTDSRDTSSAVRPPSSQPATPEKSPSKSETTSNSQSAEPAAANKSDSSATGSTDAA